MTGDGSGGAAKPKAPRALIADDDEMMRLLIETMTTESGYEVEVAENGARAWEAYQRDRPTQLILDWQIRRARRSSS